MNVTPLCRIAVGIGCVIGVPPSPGSAAEGPVAPRAYIDGTGPGWKELGEQDFVNVNGDPDTWRFKDGVILCSGRPTGVARTRESYKNFEFVARWRHLQSGGNSGFFVWAPAAALKDLKPGSLPSGGIEVQVLDHGFAEQYLKSTGKPGDWFTTHGDVFAVGTSTIKPFAPLSPNGSRSFPSRRLSKGVGEWNHYYVRCINGELRLWVNGEEVSGGTGCRPAEGHLCLEAEGSPVEFQQLRVRVLP